MSVTAANEATAGLAKKDQNEASGSGKMMSHPDVKIPSYIGKVITHKLRGEVYLKPNYFKKECSSSSFLLI